MFSGDSIPYYKPNKVGVWMGLIAKALYNTNYMNRYILCIAIVHIWINMCCIPAKSMYNTL